MYSGYQYVRQSSSRAANACGASGRPAASTTVQRVVANISTGGGSVFCVGFAVLVVGEINLFREFRQGLIPDGTVEDAAGDFDALFALVAFRQCDRAIMGGLISSVVIYYSLNGPPGDFRFAAEGGVTGDPGHGGIAVVVQGHSGCGLKAQVEVFACNLALRSLDFR